MASNTDVAQAWAHGRACAAGHLKTDGYSVWSYYLRIGVTLRKGDETCSVVLGYRGTDKVSQTTSCHVGRVARYADKLIPPNDLDGMLNDGWTVAVRP